MKSKNARGNRLKGLRRLLSEKAHEAAVYDLEIETGLHSPEDGARLVLGHLASGAPPSACRELWAAARPA